MMNRISARVRALGLGFLLILGAAEAGCLPADRGEPSSPAESLLQDETGSRRALIVAIANYAPETGWWPISSNRDIPLVRLALEGQGFSSIEVLTDEKATREGIVKAFRETLLERARPGDLVVFHYSGHGQQITDDGADEPDGYDEAIVPYDAPLDRFGGYSGDRHLRDDELNRLIQELRRKVGPQGHVAVFLDTCFSGTPRGGGLPERGGPPLGPPAAGRNRSEPGSGFYEAPSARGRQIRRAGLGQLAPYVVFSAARHNEVAQEILGDDGLAVGSLTYAVTRELERLPPVGIGPAEPEATPDTPEAGAAPGEAPPASMTAHASPVSGSGPSSGSSPSWTNRRFYERVRWVMAGRVSNQPQLEGDIDTLVFGGRLIVPEPYVSVTQVTEDRRTARLAAGTLAGMMAGTRIEIHREGTLRPSPGSRLASGTVIRSTPTAAVLELEDGAARRTGRSELEQGRAFITHHAFGPLHVTVQLSGVEPALAARLTRLLEERVSAVGLVEDKAEILVRVEGVAGAADTEEPHVVVETSADGVQLLPSTPLSAPGLEEGIGRRLLDYARNRHFRNLRLPDPAFQVDLEIIPVRGLGCQGKPIDYTTCTGFEDLDPKNSSATMGARVWRPGDLYRLKTVHHGSRSAHINVLDLQPDGVIRLFWPPESTRDRTALAPGQSWDIPGNFVVTEPAGVEVLLLIASEEWIDLNPFASREVLPAPGMPRGDLGPFAPLFDDPTIRARSAQVYPGRVHTSAVVLTVATGDSAAPGRRGSEAAGRGRRPR